MPQLSEFTNLAMDVLCKSQAFMMGDPYNYIDPEELASPYDFPRLSGNVFWKELARGTRGLQLIVDTPEELLEIFEPWWSMRSHEFYRIFYTAILKYNALHNYDRTEEITETTTNQQEATGNRHDNTVVENNDVSHVTNETEENGSSSSQADRNATNTHKVVGYNSAADEYSDAHQDIQTSTENGEGATNSNSTSKSTATNSDHGNLSATSKDKRNVSGTANTQRSVRMYGNIGVTTTQQMLAEERRLMRDHVINYVLEDFKKDFCIMVY